MSEGPPGPRGLQDEPSGRGDPRDPQGRRGSRGSLGYLESLGEPGNWGRLGDQEIRWGGVMDCAEATDKKKALRDGGGGFV